MCGEQSSRVERRRASRTTVGLQATALATLDTLQRGVVLLDKDGTVQFVNRAARAMLQRRNGPVLRQHRLTFSQLTAASTFDDWLASGRDSLVLRVAAAGRRWQEAYRVVASPFGARSTEAYCVFIYEPHGGRRHLPIQVLRQLYGLSAAEARLVNAIFAGQSLRSAAEELCISPNTAKTQLKRIFVKCEVGCQAELLQFLSLGPRTL
jgi:DNA-binding CsgD family transcriptional regulator